MELSGAGQQKILPKFISLQLNIYKHCIPIFGVQSKSVQVRPGFLSFHHVSNLVNLGSL